MGMDENKRLEIVAQIVAAVGDPSRPAGLITNAVAELYWVAQDAGDTHGANAISSLWAVIEPQVISAQATGQRALDMAFALQEVTSIAQAQRDDVLEAYDELRDAVLGVDDELRDAVLGVDESHPLVSDLAAELDVQIRDEVEGEYDVATMDMAAEIQQWFTEVDYIDIQQFFGMLFRGLTSGDEDQLLHAEIAAFMTASAAKYRLILAAKMQRWQSAKENGDYGYG